ncbi:MAG: copper resistance system multicopper oxidase [Sphingomonadales bacterium]
MISRRKFIKTSTSIGGAFAMSQILPTWAKSMSSVNMSTINVLSGNEFDLSIGKTTTLINGKEGQTITVNGTLPAPLLRWKEGEEVTLRVTNHLNVDSSIHWHGLLLPFQMDGVPGVNFPGIKAGETFTYKFPLKQSGTYWYHSHSGLQEQSGLYGPIIIDPKSPDPVSYDREYVIVLSDWTFEDPHKVFSKLKKMSDFYNFRMPTTDGFFKDVKEKGIRAAIADRKMWGGMRMNPTDISDVTGSTYTYLLNGHSSSENWTGIFNTGERIRLRFINASAMSFFNVRIPGLSMTVVQADGLNVRPVETDEFQIGVAETYDVIISPNDKAYTLMCESIDRSGYVCATLSPNEGMTAEIPALREPPTLTMADMGMNHAAMGHNMEMPKLEPKPMDHSTMGHDMAMPMEESKPMDHAAMGHTNEAPKKMNMSSPIMEEMAPQAHNHAKGPGVANLTKTPSNRLSEPGIGLENVPHRTLTYMDLKSLKMIPDMREPGRELEIHLTGNMERYMWSLDGVKFSEVKNPIVFHEGERVRLTLVNDTMMPHPIHLHGMYFDVVTGDRHFRPRKHTIIVKPAEKLSIDITADAVGDWAFHCHLLFHMHAGMMQVVSVKGHKMGGDE